jgi:hypothetical protein
MKASYLRKEMARSWAKWTEKDKAWNKTSTSHWEEMHKAQSKDRKFRMDIIIQERLLAVGNPWELVIHKGEAILYAKGETEELEKMSNDRNGYHYSFELEDEGLEIRVNDGEVELIQKKPGALDRAVDKYGLVVEIGKVGEKIAELKDQLGTLERMHARFARGKK